MRLLATGEFETAEQQSWRSFSARKRARGGDPGGWGKAEAIRLVNEAAERYFVGNAQTLKQLETLEASLRNNAKIVITENGIHPTLLLGDLPVSMSPEKQANGK
jgi:hypothetical protein